MLRKLKTQFIWWKSHDFWFYSENMSIFLTNLSLTAVFRIWNKTAFFWNAIFEYYSWSFLIYNYHIYVWSEIYFCDHHKSFKLKKITRAMLVRQKMSSPQHQNLSGNSIITIEYKTLMFVYFESSFCCMRPCKVVSISL